MEKPIEIIDLKKLPLLQLKLCSKNKLKNSSVEAVEFSFREDF